MDLEYLVVCGGRPLKTYSTWNLFPDTYQQTNILAWNTEPVIDSHYIIKKSPVAIDVSMPVIKPLVREQLVFKYEDRWCRSTLGHFWCNSEHMCIGYRAPRPRF